MKLAEWEKRLVPSDMIALSNYGHTRQEEDLTADEVLDIIVDWNGGVRSGYALRALVARIYGRDNGHDGKTQQKSQ